MRRNLTAFIFTSLLLTSSTIWADVQIPAVLDSHMVIQQEKPVVLWGKAEPGEEIKVTFGNDTGVTKANTEGNWHVKLPARKASAKPATITIKGNNKIELTDVLVGEVWVGSGQSNMEWQLQRTQNSKEAIAAANHPQIRLLHVKKVQTPEPAWDIVKNDKLGWKPCTSENIPQFSGVLYYFGKKLHEELKVPIGLINSSWGGSPIEPWTVTEKGSGKMYNGMIAPLRDFAVRGSIWYQGETNVIQKNGFAYAGKNEGPDHRLARILGRRHAFPVCADCPLGEYPLCRRSATRCLGSPSCHTETPPHRNGSHHGFGGQYQRHPPAKQTGCREPAGTLGTGENLWTKCGLFRTLIPVDENRRRQNPAELRAHCRGTEIQ